MDYIVHGVTKSRTQLSSFHFHAEEPPGKKETSGWAPVQRAPYLPHLKSTAGTRTPIQSRRCSPRRCRTPRAGPGHRQAAGLWVQSGFQLGLGLVSSNSGDPGEPPGESGGRRSEGAGEGSAAAAPAPAASTAGLCAAVGWGGKLTEAETLSVGTLRWPSPGPLAGLPGLQDWERVARAPRGDSPRVQAYLALPGGRP